MKRICVGMCRAVLLVALAAESAEAAVEVHRAGAENPMQEVAKSVLYGGLAGLMLGSAVALANDGKNGGEIMKWGFVGGTFLGLGLGIHHLRSRPEPRALIEWRDGRIRPGRLEPLPKVGGARLAVIGARF